MKKIIIDASRGGDDVGNTNKDLIEKDFNLKISNYIYNRLKDLNADVYITRTDDKTISNDERIAKINSKYGTSNNVILIASGLNSGSTGGVEIIYALRNSDNFSQILEQNFENNKINVNKYYQRRLPSSPEKDYHYLLRDSGNIEALIIEYGYTGNDNDYDLVLNNYELLGESVVKALASYLGLTYDTTSTSNNYYIVTKGDTLYSIAKNNNMTVDEIKKLNNLSSNLLSVGQKLILSSTQDNYYTVKKGDTLYSIAKNNNMTVDELKKLNNLTSNTLSIGQKLKIK